jgi:hypothetical protein
MNRLVCQLRSAVTAKICLAAAAFFCFGAGQAVAGCLDGVVVLARLSPEQRSLIVRIMIGRSCSDATQSQGPACTQCPFAPLGDGPCRGPHCSNERRPQGAPLSPTAPTRTIHACVLGADAVNLRAAGFAGYLHPPFASAPIDRNAAIFHPPRAVS